MIKKLALISCVMAATSVGAQDAEGNNFVFLQKHLQQFTPDNGTGITEVIGVDLQNGVFEYESNGVTSRSSFPKLPLNEDGQVTAETISTLSTNFSRSQKGLDAPRPSIQPLLNQRAMVNGEDVTLVFSTKGLPSPSRHQQLLKRFNRGAEFDIQAVPNLAIKQQSGELHVLYRINDNGTISYGTTIGGSFVTIKTPYTPLYGSTVEGKLSQGNEDEDTEAKEYKCTVAPEGDKTPSPCYLQVVLLTHGQSVGTGVMLDKNFLLTALHNVAMVKDNGHNKLITPSGLTVSDFGMGLTERTFTNAGLIQRVSLGDGEPFLDLAIVALDRGFKEYPPNPASAPILAHHLGKDSLKNYSYTGVGYGYSYSAISNSGTRRLGNLIHSETMPGGFHIKLMGADGIGHPSDFPCKSDSGSPAFVEIQTDVASPTIKVIVGILTNGNPKFIDGVRPECADTATFVNLTNEKVQLAIVRTLNKMVKALRDKGDYLHQYPNGTFPEDTLFIDESPTDRPKLAITFVASRSNH